MIINYLIFATLISNIRFTESKIRVFIKNIVQQMCCPIHLLNFYHKGMEGNGIIRNSRFCEKEQILRTEQEADDTRQTKHHNFAMFCPPPTDPIKR